MPDDLISPRFLTPRNAVNWRRTEGWKSDFFFQFSDAHCSRRKFLGLKPPNHSKFSPSIRDRLSLFARTNQKAADPSRYSLSRIKNFCATPQIETILNDRGVEMVYNTIKNCFGDNLPPDIVCVDPIRNVFDGGSENGNENDNNAMLFFLQNRIGKLRSMLNPDIESFFCHHTKKMKKKMLRKIRFRHFLVPEVCEVLQQGLNSSPPQWTWSKIKSLFWAAEMAHQFQKIIEKLMAKWTEVNVFSERLIQQRLWSQTRCRARSQTDVILQLIADEAFKGNVYTGNQFVERFENVGRAWW